jgi:hypothetical protein
MVSLVHAGILLCIFMYVKSGRIFIAHRGPYIRGGEIDHFYARKHLLFFKYEKHL